MIVVVWGFIVCEVEKVVKLVEVEGIFVEIIDLRIILLIDEEIILNFVKKIGKFMVVIEVVKFYGLVVEFIIMVNEKVFFYLEVVLVCFIGFDIIVFLVRGEYYYFL